MDKIKHVLYISYDGMTDPLGQSQVLPYLTQLSSYGFKFTLISCEKEEKFIKIRNTIQGICDSAGINWYPLPYTKSPPVISTLKDLRRIRTLAKKLHNENAFSIVHCRSYISAMVGVELKRKGVAFLFDMRGLWANEKVDAGAWKLNNPLYRFVYNYYKKKEKQFFEVADFTISLTEAGKKEIHSWKHLYNNPISIQVIPCCADINHFSKENINHARSDAFKKELGIDEDDFILSYLGSIGTWYMLDEMLDFFVELLIQKPNAKFLFITGDEQAIIRQKFVMRNLDEHKLIIIKGERKDVPSLIALSDFSIFFIQPYYSKIASSPTKQGEIMAMGVPVICNTGVGDTQSIVNHYDSGIVLKEFTTEAYKDVILKMDSYKTDQQTLINGAKEFFGLDTGVTKYLKVYEQIAP